MKDRRHEGPFEGNIDGLAGRNLFGWARDAVNRDLSISVELVIGGDVVAVASADLHRQDLEDAGIGDHAFNFVLNTATVDELETGEQVAVVQVYNVPNSVIGKFGRGFGGVLEDKNDLRKLRSLIQNRVHDLKESLVRVRQQDFRYAKSDHPNAARRFDRLFEPGLELQFANSKVGRVNRPAPSKYVEYTRHRFNIDKQFVSEENDVDVDHMLDWYINSYCALRKDLRPPFSRLELDYLNELLVFGGQAHSLTRATWMSLLKDPNLMSQVSLNNLEYLRITTYWWSVELCGLLNIADCMIPDHYVRTLSTLDHSSRNKSYPLSVFMTMYVARDPNLSSLNLDKETDRALLTLVILLSSLSRPDYLSYIPNRCVSELFEMDKTGETIISRLLDKLDPNVTSGEPWVVSLEEFEKIIRLRGYDMKTRSFTSVSENGRVHSAALPLPPESAPVDLQIIGPFLKASGLGQATRLSASIVERSELEGLTTNFVDCGIDNPALEGFSSDQQISKLRHAKVNLIHLNAESVPLVFAYEPDVFSGAYNIGYFFWELDSPAACHRLGIDLLDEIWVSSDYGVEIYRPHADIPVTNVGMCYEDLPDIDLEEARRFLENRFQIDEGTFVFFMAFDSFSYTQRKNPIGTIRAFRRAFRKSENVSLAIKTQNRDALVDPEQIRMWNQLELTIAADPRIVVINETLDYRDVLQLKKGSDCYVSLHRSEGWGFGMVEAMNLGTPVICTAYSGNLDFCTPGNSWLVDFEEVQVFPSEYIFVRKGQKWAEPSIEDAAQKMREVYKNRRAREKKATQASKDVQSNFSASAVARRYDARLKQIFGNLNNLHEGDPPA